MEGQERGAVICLQPTRIFSNLLISGEWLERHMGTDRDVTAHREPTTLPFM